MTVEIVRREAYDMGCETNRIGLRKPARAPLKRASSVNGLQRRD